MKYATNDKIGQLKLSISFNIPGLPPIPVNNYQLIVADPPWQYQLRETDRTHRGRCPYPAMSDQEILALPVGAIAHQNSYLLLWVTNNHLSLGFQCLESWGFAHKSIFTWVKTTKASTEDDPKMNIGIGYYGRNCTEHGLTNIPNVIFAPRSRHSEKPQAFWNVAEKLAEKLGGSKIELFARSKRNGWESWGAEAEC